MHVSLGLPTHQVDAGADLLSGAAIGTLSAAAEAAGFAAVYVTEHPFPSDDWLAAGGHHALDPLVALSFAAATTTTIRLHTNLFVAAYRNPFLAAKGIATLDALSGGRVMLGIGAGYLEGEFAALGADFGERNDRTDEAIVAMRSAWTGQSVATTGASYEVGGNTMLPRPVQPGGPPIWIGGNSRRAIRRAVELADGWAPFPNPPRFAGTTRTASIVTPDDLAIQIAYATQHAETIGRTAPLEVMFIPRGLSMGGPAKPFDAPAVVDSCAALAAVGVGWVTVSFAEADRAGQLGAIDRFATEVLPHLPTTPTSAL